MVLPARNVPKPPIETLHDVWSTKYGLTAQQYNKIKESRFQNRVDFSGNRGHIEYVVIHSQVGNNRGSLEHWASAGVEASSTVMIGRDGIILQVIPESDGPWTNGDMKNPTPEASELIATARGSNLNIWCLTIEFEDNGDTSLELTPAQYNAGLWQLETWCINYPQILKHRVGFLRHRYINTVDKYRCPDTYADGSGQGKFNHLLTGLNEWLDTGSKPTYAKPDTKLQEKLGNQHCMSISGGIVVRFRDWVQFTEPVTPHQYANVHSPAIADDVTGNIQVVAIIELGNGEKWFLSKGNARYLITGKTFEVL